MTARRPPPTVRELRQQSLQQRMLGRQAAAFYCDVSAKKFSRLVKEGRAPQPPLISAGSSQVHKWDIRELDDYLDRLPTAGDPARSSGATPRRLFIP